MAKLEFCGSRWMMTPLLVAVALWSFGCASVATDGQWPAVDVESDVPQDVDGEPRFERGGDGALYIVGEFETTPEVGQSVFGRYADAWPLDEMDRPALFAGEIVERHSSDVARVHPTYQFPETEVESLGVDVVDDRGDESMGKGISAVTDVDGADESEDVDVTQLTLSLGSEAGVEVGDKYGVLRPFDTEEAPAAGQLTRRLGALCMVTETEANSARCRIRDGHPDAAMNYEVESGWEAVFLEPTFGSEPPELTVLVASLDDEQHDDRMVNHLQGYFDAFPAAGVSVELIDEDVEAEDPDFHRWSRRISSDGPALLVGASLDDDGERLTLNYTGVSTAIGPGMVAAPPEGGVDMGPVDDVDDEQWRGFSSMLMGAALVYRGQTALALRHLQQALQDHALAGKWRWHARDQYAMRWASLDHYEEAMWLVLEDEALGRRDGDTQAEYNALGTRIRLHDFLDQPRQAYETADRYRERRADDDPTSSGHLSAQAMFAEMAIQHDDHEAAEEVVDEIIESCPEGCYGDALSLLAGIYWAASDIDTDLQDRIVDQMVEYGERDDYSSMASARMFQGWQLMRDDDYGQALMAFLEAQRRYEGDEQETYGAARAQMYITVVEIGRGEPERAFESGTTALEMMEDLGDYRATVQIYERLAEIFMDPDFAQRRDAIGAMGQSILFDGMQRQLATGDYARAAQAQFSYGQFLFFNRALSESRAALYNAVTRAIRTASFQTVTMCHVLLALIARAEGDFATFEQEVQRAEQMADVADDPYLDELVEELQAPPEEQPSDDDPTQLL